MTEQFTDESRAMARFAYYGLTTPADEAEAAGMELSPADVIRLAEKVKAQIEWHEQEVKRLECIKRRIKRKAKGK